MCVCVCVCISVLGLEWVVVCLCVCVRAGRYDGIYRATVEMCLPGEIWPYRFNRGILLF